MSEPVRRGLASRDFVLVMLATATALCNFAPLMSVVPLWAAAGGGSGAGVGATTGAMMATTAATQLAMGPVLKRFTLRQIFVAGALIMALPTPFYLLSDQLGPVLAVSAARGVGFGLFVVAASALVAEILPAHLLARGLGIHGLATGLPMVAALPGAVWLVQQWSFTPVFLAATALALVGMVLGSMISAGGKTPEERPGPAAGSDLLDPRAERDHTAAGATDLLEAETDTTGQVDAGGADTDRTGTDGGNTDRTGTDGANTGRTGAGGAGRTGLLGAVGPLIRPALPFFTLTMALGSINTFLPLAIPDPAMVSLALFAAPAAMIAGRFGSGVIAGHFKPGRLVLPGTAVGALGMAGLALGTAATLSTWWVVIGAAVFGLGLGIAQNDALVAIMNRAGPGRHGLASTVWNFAYDAGMGTGAVLFGAVLGALDYPWAFGLTVVVIVLVAPTARRSAVT